MKKILLTFSLVLPLLITANNAFAAPQCGSRENVVSLLKEKYKEEPVAVGVSNNGGLVEVLTSKDGQTWSILITSPKGKSCLVASGEGWRQMPKTESGEGI